MSEPTRRFFKLFDGTMHESAHGDWVRYLDLTLATQRAEAAAAERDHYMRVGVKRLDSIFELEVERNALRTERDALRQDAARYRADLRDIAINYDHEEQTYDHRPHGYNGRCRACLAEQALDAALAVQPLTGGS